MKKIIFLILIMVFISSCGLLDNRSFVDEMEKDTDGFWVANRDFMVVGGDDGQKYRSKKEILERTPASAKESEDSLQNKSIEEELSIKESRLRGGELNRYNEFGHYLETTSEKIYYLDLSPIEREEYLINKGVPGLTSSLYENDRKEANRAKMRSIVKDSSLNKEVWLGMDESDVVRSWGRPQKVEVAGNPVHRNERWVFYENGRVKFIYFENGKVQGWAID